MYPYVPLRGSNKYKKKPQVAMLEIWPTHPLMADTMAKNFSQEGLVPAVASSLIILAEFSRVFLLSNTSNK